MKSCLLLYFIPVLVAACSNKAEKKIETTDTSEIHAIKDSMNKAVDTSLQTMPPVLADGSVLPNAKTIIQLIKQGNFAEIAQYISPVSGLGFSTNGYISKTDLNFTREQVAGLWNDAKKYKIRDYNGEDTLQLTFREYYKSHVYDKDYAGAGDVALNKMKRGPTPGLFNLKEIYPAAAHVDFYIPAPANSELDWATLRLIFVKENDNWFLRHIVHDNWTP